GTGFCSPGGAARGRAPPRAPPAPGSWRAGSSLWSSLWCRSSGGLGEFVDVGASRLRRGPARGAQCVGQLLGELADVDGELAALLGQLLVLAERAVDRPVDLLQRSEHGDRWLGPAPPRAERGLDQ